MGYKALINKNVSKAFNLVKDLAEVVTLVKKTASTYSFDTQSANVTEAAGLVTKAIVTDVTKSSRDKNTIRKVMLFKTNEIGELTLYDKVTYNAQTWLIGNPITSDNYITVVEVYREANYG